MTEQEEATSNDAVEELQKDELNDLVVSPVGDTAAENASEDTTG